MIVKSAPVAMVPGVYFRACKNPVGFVLIPGLSSTVASPLASVVMSAFKVWSIMCPQMASVVLSDFSGGR